MASLQKAALNASAVPAPSTLYIPIVPPPTPAPSPRPFATHDDNGLPTVNITNFSLMESFQDPTHDFSLLSEQARLEYLNNVIAQCTLRELSHISTLISPLLKRDFLRELPAELALHILSYIDDLYHLVRDVAGVCKHWRRLSNDDSLWRRMCQRWKFVVPSHLQGPDAVPGAAKRHFKVLYLQREFTNLTPNFPYISLQL